MFVVSIMEADSTTHDVSQKTEMSQVGLPFLPSPGNLSLYKELTSRAGDQRLEAQIVERMQDFGLLPDRIGCPTALADCKVCKKPARVVDRVQWVCDGCGKRQPIRSGSFFLRLSCSLQQALQTALAWTEDMDCEVAVQHFGVKPKVASTIYDKLDELAVTQQNNLKLGGEGSVVLAEMYPDCVARLSPDTTDQPHHHPILMVADTKHIPTHYQLHVIKHDLKNTSNSMEDENLRVEVSEVLSRVTVPGSIIVTGSHVPAIEGASSLQQLVQHCDQDMRHFLSSRIWRQALCVCTASRDLCPVSAPTATCTLTLQRYLDAALYRIRHSDGFYESVLRDLADQYTDRMEVCDS